MLFIFIFIEYCKWKIEVSRSNDGGIKFEEF